MNTILFTTAKRLLIILSFVLLNSLITNVSAQSDEDDDESESGFFSDINEERFKSNYGNDYESSKPNYDYNRNTRDHKFLEENIQIPQYKWDDDATKINEQGGATINMGGGSSTAPETNSPKGITFESANGVNIINPNPKGGHIDAVPDNPGDPDLPLDGGIIVLIAAAACFGAFKKGIINLF